MRRFLGAAEVETRVISGQMANAAVFSALVDYRNRWNRKGEPRRMRMVMNNHIGKGGHLSAQPMGALKDYVAIDPRTDRPAVVNFPVLPDNPYQIDVAGTLELIEQHRPELIIFGKSMVLHKEPVAEIRRFVDEQGLDAVIMYDMAHVLGPGRAPLPAALRRRRRLRHRLHAQDLLRHPAGRHRRPLPRAGRATTSCGRPCAAAPSPARSPTTTWARCSACSWPPTR